ncbi:hypothetical protein ACFE04_013460 [Oxalis oulophora]
MASTRRNLNLYFTKHKTISTPLSQSHSTNNVDDDVEDQQNVLNRNHSSPSMSHIKNHNNLTRSLSTLSLESDDHNEPDLTTIYASQRFFFPSPGRSNSIIESTPSISDHSLFDNSSSSNSSCSSCVAVSTYSPDPYIDFRQSMLEMVEARDMHVILDTKSNNWDYLHELLLCYLALNPKSTHKFIMRAFTDLLVSLVPKSDRHGSGRRKLFVG